MIVDNHALPGALGRCHPERSGQPLPNNAPCVALKLETRNHKLPYHSPAFCSLRILRRIRSRFSALRWRM